MCSDRTYETYIETRPPEVIANILVCLIHQTNYLVDQLIRKLEKAFVEEGGLRERMTRPAGAGKTEEVLKSIRGSINSQKQTLQHIAKSSSRYYGVDVVHSTNAKEKFRRFAPRQSAGPGR